MLHPCSNLLAIDAWHYFAMRLLAIHSLSIVSHWHKFACRWVSTCLGHVWPPPRRGNYWTNKPLTKYTWTLGPDGTVIENIFEQPARAPANDPDACATHWKPANQTLVPTTSSHQTWTLGPDGTWWTIDENTSRWNMIQHIQDKEESDSGLNLGYGASDLVPLTTEKLAEMCAARGINTNLCHELVFPLLGLDRD